MGWFTKDNDDDIDDIYNKLEDIYNKLEALDVVNAFSGRLSRVEKTSTYLESVLIDNMKDLEKRVDKLEHFSGDTIISTDLPDTSCVDDLQSKIDAINDDIDSIKNSLGNSATTSDTPVDVQRLNDMDEIIKNLTLKVSYLELAKDRPSNTADEISQLKEELSKKDEQIAQLNKKIESLTYIIEEDSRNIKMVAKHIIDQANSMKALKEEVHYLTTQKDKSVN